MDFDRSVELGWPEQLHQYRPVAILGDGGSGRVWRATHTPSGKEVAVKTLTARTATEKEAFRREVYALRQLRHPGVVAVVDQGVARDSPWFAMDLVEGLPLDRTIGKDTDWKLSLRRLRELCATLCYVHGEGVVHRDLKPSNILVPPGRSVPILIDFGLASRFVSRGLREVLEAGRGFSGSFEYAAPEQFLGHFVDARTDLYAVGCILHEILTGAPPFAGTLQEVMSGHLSSAPPLVRLLDPAMPQSLAEMVPALLAKDPRDRIGFAQDAVRMIDRALGEPSTDSYAGLGRSYFYRPGFAGRTQALATLRGAFERCRTGHGSCVYVKGESGIGKTRLAMEFTRYLPPDIELVTSECIAAEGHDTWRGQTPPMDAWRPLLRTIAAVCRESGPEYREHVVGDRAAILAEVELEFRALAGGEISKLTGSAARDRLIEGLALTVRRFTEDRTVVVIIDDLQWADELTLACLERFQRMDGGYGALIVGTFRPEEARSEVRSLAGEDATIELFPMDRDAVASLISDMLALAETPEALVSFLVAESEGNPFFVSEYLYAAAEAAMIRRAHDGRWILEATGAAASPDYQNVRTPGSIRGLVQRRFESLSDPSTRLLQAGAVLGRVLDATVAASVAGLSEEESASAVLQLMRRRILEEDRTGRLRFSHDKLREIGYAGIGDAAAALLHRRAGRALEARYCDEPDFPEHYGELALHLQAGGAPGDAARYFGMAGEHAFTRGAFQEARQFLATALDGGSLEETATSVVTRSRWHRMLGNSEFALGDLQRCIRETEVALDALGIPIPESTSGWALMAVREAARLAGLRARVHHAFAKDDGSPQERSIAATQLGASFYYEARLLPSAAAVLLGVNEAERCAVPARLADAYSRLAYVCGAGKLHRLANRYFDLAHRYGEQDADPRPRALSLYMDAMYRLGVAEWDRAIELGQRSWMLGMQSASIQDAEVARTIMAHAMYYSGRISDSLSEYRTILETSTLRANGQHMGWGLFLSGRACLALGRFDEAHDMVEQGYGHLAELPDAVSRAMCEGLLAMAAVRNGRLERATEVADQLLLRFRSGWHPAVGQCVDAYGSLAETALVLEEHSPCGLARERTDRCLILLRFFSWFFPVARPAFLRCRALRARLRGDAAAARRLARRAARQAAALAMPLEEYLALKEVERNVGSDEMGAARLATDEAGRRVDGGAPCFLR